jgi:hypothetical protein
VEEGSVFELDGEIEVFQKDNDTGEYVNLRDPKLNVSGYRNFNKEMSLKLETMQKEVDFVSQQMDYHLERQ